MFSSRPSRMYKKITQRNCTRKEFVRARPVHKITKFEDGNLKKKDYFTHCKIISLELAQIRDHALEAARRTFTKNISSLGKEVYRVVIKIYPHSFLRENKFASGAGADRTSSGMRGAYGKIIGVAARIKKKQTIFEFNFSEKVSIELIKRLYFLINKKLPVRSKLIFI